MKHGWYNFTTGEWMPIKCPICGNIDYDYKSYDTEFWGASVTAEQYGDCDKCGYTIRQAYSPVYEGFYDRKRGWKDSDGIYHEKNYKRHRRVRRKHLERVKQVDQSSVVRYI